MKGRAMEGSDMQRPLHLMCGAAAFDSFKRRGRYFVTTTFAVTECVPSDILTR